MEFNFLQNLPPFSAGEEFLPFFQIRWALAQPSRLLLGIPFSATLLGILLAVGVDRMWIGLSAFVGLGLCYAGLTDICPMGMALSRMPWNAVTRCKAEGGSSDEAQCCP